MALQSDKIVKGHVNNYWKIGKLETDNDTSYVRVRMLIYKDLATRTADINDYMAEYEIDLVGDDFPLDITAQDVLDNNTHKLIYNQLKTMASVILGGFAGTGQAHNFTTAVDV